MSALGGGRVQDQVADAIDLGMASGGELVEVIDGDARQAGDVLVDVRRADWGPEEEQVGVPAGEIAVRSGARRVCDGSVQRLQELLAGRHVDGEALAPVMG